MGIVLGIDIGSSATKIVAMDESKTILNSLKVSASDPVPSANYSVRRECRLQMWRQ